VTELSVTDMNQRKSVVMLPKITNHERDTILAALRAWQASPRARLGFYNLATNGGQVPPLTDAEIDALCQRLDMETGR
jgi:hypothetical protein